MSDTEVCNRALGKLGESSILDLTDNNTRARAMNSTYISVRDAELRRHIWNFSVKRDSIAALVSTPSWGYSTEYQVPSDCLRILSVNDIWPGPDMADYRNSSVRPYVIENGKILCSVAAPLKIRYVYRVTDTSLFDACFFECLASRLAYENCERITQSDSKKQLAWVDYKKSLLEGISAGSLELPSESIQDDSWVVCRL